MSTTETIAYFDRHAVSWDDRYEQSRLFQKRYRVFQDAVTRFGSKRHRALDYGCGSGVLTEILKNAFDAVVATDMSQRMLDVTAEKYKQSPNVQVMTIDALPPASFDFLICSSVIEYVEDPSQFIATLSGYLRPGGRMLITFSNTLGPLQLISRYVMAPLKKDPHTRFQRHRHSRRSILGLVKQHDLECLDLRTPLGLPGFTSLGFGELHLLVVEKKH